MPRGKPSDAALSAQAAFVETDPICAPAPPAACQPPLTPVHFFAAVLWVEDAWIKPCTASLPQPMHGMCMYGPMFLLGVILLGTVAMLAWCEQRQKKKEEAKKEATTKKKK